MNDGAAHGLLMGAAVDSVRAANGGPLTRPSARRGSRSPRGTMAWARHDAPVLHHFGGVDTRMTCCLMRSPSKVNHSSPVTSKGASAARSYRTTAMM